MSPSPARLTKHTKSPRNQKTVCAGLAVKHDNFTYDPRTIDVPIERNLRTERIIESITYVLSIGGQESNPSLSAITESESCQCAVASPGILPCTIYGKDDRLSRRRHGCGSQGHFQTVGKAPGSIDSRRGPCFCAQWESSTIACRPGDVRQRACGHCRTQEKPIES